MFFQETHWTWELDCDLLHEWRGNFLVAHGTERSRGVAILFKQNMSVHIHPSVEDSEGRYIIADINLGLRRLLLVNVYAPNADCQSLRGTSMFLFVL